MEDINLLPIGFIVLFAVLFIFLVAFLINSILLVRQAEAIVIELPL